jgi:hypothetical protein
MSKVDPVAALAEAVRLTTLDHYTPAAPLSYTVRLAKHLAEQGYVLVNAEGLAAALETVESDGLIVALGLGDPEVRTDFTDAPKEAAAAILAAITADKEEK